MANNRSFFNGSNIYRARPAAQVEPLPTSGVAPVEQRLAEARAQTERLRREKLVDQAIACNLAGVKAL